MSKTVDDLHEIYRNARLAAIFSAKDEELVADVRERAERSGIRAVVEALRDETQKFVIDAYSMDRMFSEILAPREGGATTDAIQSFEGDESDGHFSEGISRTERAGKAAVGAPERSGSGTAQHDHDGRENPRDVAGSHETGRGRDVGGQVNHGVSRDGQAAGGSTSNASKAIGEGGASVPGTPTPAAPAPNPLRDAIARARGRPLDPERDIPTLNKVAAALKGPAPDVCEWKQLGDRHGVFMRQCSKYPTESAAGPYCSNCGKPIKEAQR